MRVFMNTQRAGNGSHFPLPTARYVKGPRSGAFLFWKGYMLTFRTQLSMTPMLQPNLL